MECGTLSFLCVERQCPSMLVLDEIFYNRHTQTCSLSCGLGGEEVVVEVLLYFLCHTLSVILHIDEQCIIGHTHFDSDDRLIVITQSLTFLPYRITGIVHQVQDGAAQVLRNNHDKRHALLVFLMDTDVEATVGEIAVGETAESTSCDIDNIAGVDIDRSVGTTGDECEKETVDDDIYNLTSDEVRFLGSLLKGEDINWVKEKGIFISVLIESINEKFYDEFGDSILVDDDYPEIYEDYREDIEDYLERRKID